MNVLVSACLMGFGCRYDGGARRLACLDALGERHVLIPVCPEVMAAGPLRAHLPKFEMDG